MTRLIRTQLTRLAATVADLKERVRVAVAGEFGRAVGDAVHQVVRAALAGRAEPAPRSYDRWGDPVDGRWDDLDDPWEDDPAADHGSDVPPAAGRPTAAGVAAAVTAGVTAARLWAARTGRLAAAAGVGLVVGLLGVLGGPVARTVVAVLAAAADLLAAADALGGAAARLDPR